MSNMQSKMEIGFWRDLYKQLGHEGFMTQRAIDLEDFEEFLPELADVLRTPGCKVLEVGTGLISPLETFEGLDAKVTAIDPLMDEYAKIIPLDDRKIEYVNGSGEELPFKDGEFDVVTCLNVIDHTPNPEKMLNEIRRVLKPGGRFFFEVNFDEALSPAHYGIWSLQKVKEFFGGWEPAFTVRDFRPEYNQERYWAMFTL